MTEKLLARIAELEAENERLRAGVFQPSAVSVVRAPEAAQPLFDQVAVTMRDLFRKIDIDPARAMIAIDDERYLLVRASAFSIDFLDTLVQLYADRGEREALAIARGFLFDIAHTIGIHDARTMHAKLGARDALEKLSGGPVHFAYTGWARVDIKPESRPVPDESFCLVYEHPYSFEAAAFLRAERPSTTPVCIMSAGYSSGWCEASFGLELTAVEVRCRARGDDACLFVMAPPDRVGACVREHLGVDMEVIRAQGVDVPTYFERKRAEEEVRRSLERLEEAQDELVRKERLATVGLLVSGVAHEVNTPLGVAVTAIGVVTDAIAALEEKLASASLTKGDLRSFLSRAGQAAHLVDQNLERSASLITKFKRVSVDHAMQERRRVDLGAYLRETLDSLRPIAKSAAMRVALETRGDLDCVTFPGAIAQIVTNFVTNSALHGGKPVAAVLRASRDDGKVTLAYEDDGCGMSEDARAHAFQPFFTTRRAHGGTGLGLHIVHTLVTDVLGGRVTLESAPGEGTSFVVTFPVADP
ncbi:MAG: XylR N-terminal domain-containing protein [Labilithrix sp.]|nr:XylR N-terminal domain-containing protein [Labilithrix sp.]